MSVFGERLAELRKDKGLTQRELGKLLDISEDMISSYERGISQMPDELKVKIARRFNVSLDYLLGLIDDEVDYKRHDTLCLPACFTMEAKADARRYVALLETAIKHSKYPPLG